MNTASLRILKKILRENGFALLRTTRHAEVWARGDKQIAFPKTSPGRHDGRDWASQRSQLRKWGIPVDEPKKRTRKNGHAETPTPVAAVAVQAPPVERKGWKFKAVGRTWTRSKRGDIQISLRQALIVQDWLRGQKMTTSTVSVSELVRATGRVAMRWLKERPDVAEQMLAWVDALRPDYETVFSGTFPCDECDDVKLTPQALGLHKYWKHQRKGGDTGSEAHRAPDPRTPE